MDLGSPLALFSGLFLGLIGTALFIYGKKQANFRCLAAGGALTVIPFFVHSILIAWLVSASCLAALWFTSREA